MSLLYDMREKSPNSSFIISPATLARSLPIPKFAYESIFSSSSCGITFAAFDVAIKLPRLTIGVISK